jgi:biofilm PGA synthesis lipoprotein PgaB
VAGVDHAVLLTRGRGFERFAGALALAVILSASPVAAGAPRPDSAGRAAPLIAILCYHDLSRDPGAPLQTVSPEFLRAQIRACKAEGWTFLSLAELLARRNQPERLPPRVMVLTFDDGCRSFAQDALPILRAEHVKATLAIITSFVDHPPADLPSLLSWEELRRLAARGDVEIASHSHALHRYEVSNPYRDTAPSVATRRFLPAENRYENREEYRGRIGDDLIETQRVLRRHLDRPAAVLVWPYGCHNEMARGLAARAGFTATLTLGWRPVSAEELRSGCLPRIMVTRDMRFDGHALAWLHPPDAAIGAAEVDLDELWDPDEARFRARLDQAILNARVLGATHVFLQVCSDPRREGKLLETYAMNHQLPVRADIWSMVAAKFAAARLSVWVRAPVMNLTWAWEKHPEWRLRREGGERGSATRWGTRLAPDLPEARRAAADFFTDLAVYLPIDGVLFDDDAMMLPGERLAGSDADDPARKAAAIRELLEGCKAAVRAWRPDCQFARTIDAPVVEVSGIHPGFAQDYEEGLRDDDLTVVAAYPWMEGQGHDPARWVGKIARRALGRWASSRPGSPAPPANAPVLLMLQAYDWSAQRWIPASTRRAMVAEALRAGIAHLGVYPVTPARGELPAGLLEGTPSQGRDRGGSRPY